jgi:outer membrane protein TolC
MKTKSKCCGRNKKGLIILLFLAIGIGAFGQGLTLKQCLEYMDKNNGDLKNANTDILISKKKVDEQIGTYLPQINASSELDDNLKLPTQLVPAEIFGGTPGTYLPFTMGTKYNWSSGVQLSQSIYNPSFSTNLKSAKLNKTLSEQTLDQTHEQTVYNVSIAYYNCLVIQKQNNVQKATLESSEQSLKLLTLKFQNGMAKKIDVDKVQVSCNNIKSQLKQTELNYTQSLNILKNRMGMPVETELSLADINLDTNLSLPVATDSSNFQNRIDFQLKKTDLLLKENTKKQNITAFYPTVSFLANYNYSGMFGDFNNFSASQNWFYSTYIGVKVTIPIFDGMQKQSRLVQAKLNVEKSQETLHLTEQSIKLDIANYELALKNAIENINSEKENFDLAQTVYKETQLEYKEGVATSLDLVESESALQEAQNNYFNKLLNFYIARINLEKSKGTLINFINNQI